MVFFSLLFRLARFRKRGRVDWKPLPVLEDSKTFWGLAKLTLGAAGASSATSAAVAPAAV